MRIVQTIAAVTSLSLLLGCNSKDVVPKGTDEPKPKIKATQPTSTPTAMESNVDDTDDIVEPQDTDALKRFLDMEDKSKSKSDSVSETDSDSNTESDTDYEYHTESVRHRD